LSDRFANTAEIEDAASIYSSVLPRAIETAEMIRPTLRTPIPLQSECGWCEIHPGAAEGLTWAAMREKFPPDGDPDDPFRRRLPGMETWAEMYARVGAQLHRVAQADAGRLVVVVAHGGTVGASFIVFGHAPISDGVRLTRETKNASITEWVREDAVWHLERFNDTSHL
jgi:probable phosphoglycerate mutase